MWRGFLIVMGTKMREGEGGVGGGGAHGTMSRWLAPSGRVEVFFFSFHHNLKQR